MRFASVALAFLAAACASSVPPAGPVVPPHLTELSDVRRGRNVPIALYGFVRGGRPRPLALISHGFGGTNGAYSFLAQHLVARGYIVGSVQHELEGDPEMPTEGDPRVVRRPFWERGADNLLFVAQTLQGLRIAAPGRVLLVGHSNGGDMSMLFAARHPDRVSAIFSLDSRRFPFPRTRRPRICSARSSDQAADPGVLPSVEEQARYRMVIAPVPVMHNDMWNGSTDAQKVAMIALLDRCLAGLS